MAFQKNHFKAAKTAALILGALTPLSIGQREWDGSVDTDLITLCFWLVSPYVCFFVATELLERFSSTKKIFLIDCVIAVLLFALSVWAYPMALDETSDTAHLIFLFGPMRVFIFSFFALGFTLLFVKLATKGT